MLILRFIDTNPPNSSGAGVNLIYPPKPVGIFKKALQQEVVEKMYFTKAYQV